METVAPPGNRRSGKPAPGTISRCGGAQTVWLFWLHTHTHTHNLREFYTKLKLIRFRFLVRFAKFIRILWLLRWWWEWPWVAQHREGSTDCVCVCGGCMKQVDRMTKATFDAWIMSSAQVLALRQKKPSRINSSLGRAGLLPKSFWKFQGATCQKKMGPARYYNLGRALETLWFTQGKGNEEKEDQDQV